MTENNAAQPVLTDFELLEVGARYGRPSVALLPMWRAIESAVLSALRAPVADERAAFEAAWRELNSPWPMNSRMHDDGRYATPDIEREWRLWQARAALASAPVTHYECGRSNGDGTHEAVPVRAPVADMYVEARECGACGHVGINDSSDTLAACKNCDWSGDSPKEDHCPGCAQNGTMTAACPKCGSQYSLLADRTLDVASAPVAGEAQPVCWIEKDVLESVRDEGSDAWVYWRPAGHVADQDEMPLYAAPQASEAVPELGSTVINDACWKFIEAMPHQLPGPIFNDLKPALHAAVCHVLAAQPGAQTQGGSDAN